MQYNESDIEYGGEPTIFIQEALIAEFERTMRMEYVSDQIKTARLLGPSKVLLHEYIHHSGGDDFFHTPNFEKDVFFQVPEPNNFNELNSFKQQPSSKLEI